MVFDLVVCDLPYGVTKHKWDTQLTKQDFDLLLKNIEKVTRKESKLVFFIDIDQAQDLKNILTSKKYSVSRCVWSKLNAPVLKSSNTLSSCYETFLYAWKGNTF